MERTKRSMFQNVCKGDWNPGLIGKLPINLNVDNILCYVTCNPWYSHTHVLSPASTTIAAHWVGFYDSESGLLSMEWRVGTMPGHHDVMAPTQLLVTNKASASLTQPLPLNETIYVTLKVFNKAGIVKGQFILNM